MVKNCFHIFTALVVVGFSFKKINYIYNYDEGAGNC